MPETKKEISERINGILGLDPPLHFEKLSRKELERLWDVVSKLPSLLQVGARAGLERVMEGPAAQTAREVLNMPILQRWKELRESGGFVGLFERKLRQRKGSKDEESKESP